MPEKLRKIPRQRRACQTVDFILEAAAYILSEQGIEGFTTNRIAERAGVNIASLYQYFPNKGAILEELQARHLAAPDDGYAPLLNRLRNLPLEIRPACDRRRRARNACCRADDAQTVP